MQEDIPLRADQKTDVWCVAKLERYLAESTGFISVIPRRPAFIRIQVATPRYIGRELNLARRARVPRLLFIDEKVLKRHRLEFPVDAVSFDADALGRSTLGAITRSFDSLEFPPRQSLDGNANSCPEKWL